MDRKTQELINKKLAISGIRDLEFPTIQDIDGSEAIPVVHNGHNKLLNIDTILKVVSDNLPNIFIAEDVLSFKDALSKIPIKKRVQGLVVTYKIGGYYYTKRYIGESPETSEFTKNQNWIPLSGEESNFKGVFPTKQDLQYKSLYPKIGDIAFVGDKVSTSIQYKFTTSGWIAEEALDDNAKKTEVIYSRPTDSRIISTGHLPIQDSAYKDHLGRIIAETYITKCELITQLKQIISSTEGININFIDNNNSCNSNLEEIMFKKLFERLKSLFSTPLSLQDIEDNLAIRGNVLYFQGNEIGRFEPNIAPPSSLTPQLEKRSNNSNVEIRVGVGNNWSDWIILSPNSNDNSSTDNSSTDTPPSEEEFTATYSYARNDNNAVKAELRRVGKNRVSIIIAPSEGINLSDYNVEVHLEDGTRIVNYSDIQLTKNTKFMIYALYQKGGDTIPSPNPGGEDTTEVNVRVEYLGDIPFIFEIVQGNVNMPRIDQEARELRVPRGSRITLKYQANLYFDTDKEYLAIISKNDSEEIQREYKGSFDSFENIQVDVDTVLKFSISEKPKVNVTINKNSTATPLLSFKHKTKDGELRGTRRTSFEAYVGDKIELATNVIPTTGYLIIKGGQNSDRVITGTSGKYTEEFVITSPMEFTSKIWNAETVPIQISAGLSSNGEEGNKVSVSLLVDRKDKIDGRLVSIGKEYITLASNSDNLCFNKYDVIESISTSVNYREGTRERLHKIHLFGINEHGGTIELPVGRVSYPNVTWDTENSVDEFLVEFRFVEPIAGEDSGPSDTSDPNRLYSIRASIVEDDYEMPEMASVEVTYDDSNPGNILRLIPGRSSSIPHGARITKVDVTGAEVKYDKSQYRVSVRGSSSSTSFILGVSSNEPYMVNSDIELDVTYFSA